MPHKICWDGEKRQGPNLTKTLFYPLLHARFTALGKKRPCIFYFHQMVLSLISLFKIILLQILNRFTLHLTKTYNANTGYRNNSSLSFLVPFQTLFSASCKSEFVKLYETFTEQLVWY